MPAMIGAIEAPGVPGDRRSKPRLLCRGRMRKRVTRLLEQAEYMLSRDYTENNRATLMGYSPYLFIDTKGSKMEKALTLVINHCYEVLQDKG